MGAVRTSALLLLGSLKLLLLAWCRPFACCLGVTGAAGLLAVALAVPLTIYSCEGCWKMTFVSAIEIRCEELELVS